MFRSCVLDLAINMGEIEVEPVADLETVRNLVDKLELNSGPPKDHAGNAMPKLSPDWCFVDCTYDTIFIYYKNVTYTGL